MRMNSKMAALLNSHERRVEYAQIPDELSFIINGGFLEIGGCFILKNLMRNHYYNYFKENVFDDDVAKESFVNSIFVEDFCKNNRLKVSFKTISDVFSKWENQKFDLISVLSTWNNSYRIKFFTKRFGISYLGDDIESYKSAAVIEIDSSERDLFFKSSHFSCA